MAKNTKPAIRFKGFTDAWEQRKLVNDLKSIQTGTNKLGSTENTGMPLLKMGNIQRGYFSLDKLEYLDENDVVEPENIAYKGDFFFNTRNTLDLVGKGATWTGDSGKYAFNSNIARFNLGELDTIFFNYLYNTGSMQKQVHARAMGTTSVAAIYPRTLDSITYCIPCKEEQLKIGYCLKNIDDLITLHQRKYDSLVNVKKAMLEKMFPKNGETVPEIRFKGFTDAWEQRKLSGIYQNIGNAFVGTATPYYVEDGHFYLESNNIKDGQINRNSEIFINDEFYEKQKDKWLHTGDMVMVQSGHVGHAAVIPEELDNSAAHALIMFRNPKEKVNPYFLNYQYQTNKAKKKIEGITTGNTIKHILASDMQEFVVDVPDFEEQEIIGAYFQQLDNLITLHQRKLEKLKNIKKSCLEKMFV